MKEREHLRGDAVDSAVDDADEGDREAARNLRNGKHHFFFLGIGYVNTGDMLAAAGVGRRAGLACVLFDVRLRPPGVRPGGVIRRCGRATRKRSTADTAVGQSVAVRAGWVAVGHLG
jgi:hypothetical protein